MKFQINGREIEETLAKDTILSEALQTIQDSYVSDSEVITTILVDGEHLTPDQLTNWKDRSIEEFDEANVEIMPRNSFAASGLRVVATQLQETAAKREEIVELIQRIKIDRQRSTALLPPGPNPHASLQLISELLFKIAEMGRLTRC